MARAKKSMTVAKPEHAEPIKPLPFPGESPTVSLAMAAAQMYGLHEEDEKPARAASKAKGRTPTAKSKKPAHAAKTGGKSKRSSARA